MYNCSKCGKPIQKEDRFCGHCGEKISEVVKEEHSCPRCGFLGQTEDMFCQECGTPLTKPEKQPASKKRSNKTKSTKNTKNKRVEPKKKKKSFLRSLMKFVLWFFVLFIAGTVILYYIGSSDWEVDSGTETITEIPLHLEVNELISKAQTIIPEPYDVVSNTISEEGGVIKDTNMHLMVPAGAIESHENIEIKKIHGQLPVGQESRGQSLGEVVPISKPYDFGPDGIQFQKPVTVTLKYDEKSIPSGMNESDVAMLYFDGVKWVKLNGEQNKENNTYSASVDGFPGSLVILGAVLTTVAAIGYKLKVHKKIGQLLNDPIKNNQIHTFIQPKNKLVKKYAKKIAIVTQDGEKLISFDDPKALAKYFENNTENDLRIGFKNKRGKKYTHLREKYVSSLDYVEPVENYINKIEAQEDKYGDCIEVTNALVSILRAKGYDIKGVSGYVKGKPHAWSEIVIGEEVYGIDEYGVITKLDYHKKYITYPKEGDPYRKEWDEKGTRPYGPTLIIIPPTDKIQVDDHKKHTFSVKTFNLPPDAQFTWNINKLGKSIKSRKKSIQLKFPATGKNTLEVTAYWSGKKKSKSYSFTVFGKAVQKQILTGARVRVNFFGRFKYMCGDEAKDDRYDKQIGAYVDLNNSNIDYNTISATTINTPGSGSLTTKTNKIELEFRDINDLKSLENFTLEYAEKNSSDKNITLKEICIGKGIPFKEGKVLHKKSTNEYALKLVYNGDLKKYIKKLEYTQNAYCNNTYFGVKPDLASTTLKDYKKEGDIEVMLYYKKE